MLPTVRTSLFGLLLFSNSALCLTIQKRFPVSTYQVKESHFVPRSWSRIGSAPADHTINLRIGLTQSRFDELEKSLYEGKITETDCAILVPNLSHENFPE
jgi:tripeptidyl-peptidase-1